MKNEELSFCKCGCGQRVKSKTAKYIRGHACNDPAIKKLCAERTKAALKAKFGVDNPSKIASSVEKRKRTCIERFGVDNPSKNKDVVNKISQTIEARYGVKWATQKSDYVEKAKATHRKNCGKDWATQTDEVKQKAKQTNLEKFGTEYYQQCDEAKEHYKELSRLHYGTDYAFQAEEVKKKILETVMRRYGVPNVMYDYSFVKKIKNTNIERYGDEDPNKNPEVKKKRDETMLSKFGVKNIFEDTEFMKEKVIQKFGVDNVLKDPEIKAKAMKSIIDYSWECIQRHVDKWIPCFTRDDFKGWKDYIQGTHLKYKFKCAVCGCEKTMTQYYAQCPVCNPFKNRSHSEVDIQSYIESLGVQTVPSERSILSGSKELDIYIPSKNIAIEFDGLYWHSTAEHPETDYHLSKTKECEAKGIQLVHVFEDEWLNKQDIVKSRIKNILGIYDKVVYARKCEVREIKNKKEYIDFLNDNHIQGYVASKHPIGLYYDNELVSCMTFGGLRKSMGSVSTEGVYEMLRFCNKMGYHIPGAASRLFKYFVKHYNPVKVISYCDRRWSKGNLYEKLGFRMSHVSQPNYWYIDPTYSFREYRFKYRKSELPKLLEYFDPTLTEQQNMIGNGFGIIYDCGNYVFEWVK